MMSFHAVGGTQRLCGLLPQRPSKLQYTLRKSPVSTNHGASCNRPLFRSTRELGGTLCSSRLQAANDNVASPEEGGSTSPDENVALATLSGIKKVSWLSFWIQLALSLASGGVLFFTTITVKKASISTLFLAVGVAMSLISTAIIRVVLSKARRISEGGSPSAGLQDWDVGGFLLRNTDINLVGMAATIVALQNEIGLLVAKTLASSSANPYTAQGAPAAIDIFAVQGSANVLMAHFVSLLAVTFLLRFIRKFTKTVVDSKILKMGET
ncbi:hypothetical protein BSKO_10601 [Bryopsis sp. KO-2023]|nr:hypothetical protein BSKO_10601 [Bryopsis sp. KO-2023]